MSVEKVMEILNQFESQAEADIQTDYLVYMDPYEKGERHILVLKIKRIIQKEIEIDDKEAA